MAFSRLIQARSGLRVDRCAFSKPVRCFSAVSSDSEIEKPSQLKKAGIPREQRAVAAESFVKKYMETNPGVFPKVVHIQNEVGGSWYTVKEILNNIKEKILGTTQLENHHKIDSSTPAKHAAASNVVTTHSVPDSGIELRGHQDSALGANQVPQGEEKEGNTGNFRVTEEGECSSDLTVDPKSSDVTNKNNASISSEHDKLNSIGCLDQEESKTAFSLSPNSSVEMSTKSATPNSFHGVRRLSNLFQFGNDEAVSEAKNKNVEPEQAMSDILLGHRKEKNSQGNSLLSFGISQQSHSYSGRQDLRVNSFLSSSYKNQQTGLEMVAPSQTQNIMPESFAGSKNLMGLEDMNEPNTQASVSMTNSNRDISMHSFLRYLEEPTQKDEVKRSEIKGLMDAIKVLPGGPSTARSKQKISSCKTDESGDISQLGIQSKATLWSYDKEERNKSPECHALHRNSNREGPVKAPPASLRTQADKMSSLELAKPTGHLTSKESYEIQHKISIMEKADENKVLVKFLHRDLRESDIVHALEKWGDIVKVEVSSPEGVFYRNADVHFKTRKGLRKALSKTDLMVGPVNVTVQAAATGEDVSNGITIPHLIDDPNVPSALVKNPSRTVKITQLASQISSIDVVAALESWGGNVTGFFFGKLDSVAFVEFEEEDQKEAVLAKHSIDVLGKRLLISRIDTPRTTVVRISFHRRTNVNQVVTLCNSLGKTMNFLIRNGCTVDVHFKIAEWPNMLKILNRLNEAKVNGHRLQAQPASVIPPQILEILWRQPEGRLYVKNVVRRLLQKLEENVVHETGLADLPNFY